MAWVIWKMCISRWLVPEEEKCMSPKTCHNYIILKNNYTMSTIGIECCATGLMWGWEGCWQRLYDYINTKAFASIHPFKTGYQTGTAAQQHSLCLSADPARRHGSTRVPGQALLAWCSSWRMVVYIYYVRQLEISLAHSWAASVWATGTVQKGQAVRHHVQYHTCWVALLQTARRAAVLGQPSSLRLHCGDPPSSAEAEFLDDIGKKISRVFLAFNSHLC